MTKDVLSKSVIFRRLPEDSRRAISVMDAIITHPDFPCQYCDSEMKEKQIEFIRVIEFHYENIRAIYSHIDALTIAFDWDLRAVNLFKSLFELTGWNLHYDDTDETGESLFDNHLYNL